MISLVQMSLIYNPFITSVSFKESKFTPLNQYEEWLFDPFLNDWINLENEAILLGYSMPLN